MTPRPPPSSDQYRFWSAHLDDHEQLLWAGKCAPLGIVSGVMATLLIAIYYGPVLILGWVFSMLLGPDEGWILNLLGLCLLGVTVLCAVILLLGLLDLPCHRMFALSNRRVWVTHRRGWRSPRFLDLGMTREPKLQCAILIKEIGTIVLRPSTTPSWQVRRNIMTLGSERVRDLYLGPTKAVDELYALVQSVWMKRRPT